MLAAPRLGFRVLRTILSSSTTSITSTTSTTSITSITSKQLLSTTPTRREYFFTAKHEYVKVEGNTGTIGVSQHAADALGDVVYAQLPEPGTSLQVGEECGAVESVKAASEIYSPVSGTVTAKNEEVENDPALINAHPLTEGWLFKLDLKNLEETKNLMDSAAYEKFLQEE